MTFRADGTSVVNVTDAGTSGVALAFDPDMARQIAEALNKHLPGGSRSKVDPLSGDTVAKVDFTDPRPLSDVIGKGTYVKVVGPYATALMGTPDGRQIRSLAEGAILPSDVTAGHARHLIDVGLAAVVEAKSAAEVFEAAPTERHRVEMTSTDVIGPTVGTPTPGSPAAQYDQDPIAAAQAAAEGRFATSGVVTQTTGAGLGLPGDPAETPPAPADAGDEPAGDEPPAGNASRDLWVAYASTLDYADSQDLRPVDEGGLSRDALRTKYGS